MDVTAYDTQGVLQPAQLGAVAQGIWINGFKYSEERIIQVSKPINAPVPNLFDRILSLENFQFAAARSFSGTNPLGQALKFLGTHAATVPRLANLLFVEAADGSNQTVWLKGCGITKVELVDKKGALVIFAYTIVGGAWSLT